MNKLVLTIASILLTLTLSAQDTTYNVILDFANCGKVKTFTYKLEAECHPTEMILRRWLLKDVGTPAENASLHTFFFAIKGEESYELTRGKSLWADFSKKMMLELDSINKLDAAHRAVLLGLSKKDSLHNIVNRLPGLTKKRDNFWKARKAKKTTLKELEPAYKEAKAAFDEGDLEPEEWDKIEEQYLSVKNEFNYLKRRLAALNKEISDKRKTLVRLKEETGLYDYKSYRDGSY